MTDDTTKKIISLAEHAASTGQTVDDEDGEEFVSVEEEFRELYGSAQALREKMLRMAKSKQEEGNPTEANILRVIAGDVLPLLSDLIATSGGAIAELEDSAGGASGEDGGLDGEEATQLYITILSNMTFLQNLSTSATDPALIDGLKKLISLNENSLGLLRDTFGDEIQESAQAVLTEAASH
jgi:hypothetical protein